MPKRKLVLERVTRKRDIVGHACYLGYDPHGDFCAELLGGDLCSIWRTGAYKGWSFYGPIPTEMKP